MTAPKSPGDGCRRNPAISASEAAKTHASTTTTRLDLLSGSVSGRPGLVPRRRKCGEATSTVRHQRQRLCSSGSKERHACSTQPEGGEARSTGSHAPRLRRFQRWLDPGAGALGNARLQSLCPAGPGALPWCVTCEFFGTVASQLEFQLRDCLVE